ncbi:alpha/beta fold hydrolase [Actinomadura scrupuli]|uniref:alpha/beta fold hydrolase n=1 Tax=Actinomadura scrupuli TaxID=559629 RepID=UPI003D964A4F
MSTPRFLNLPPGVRRTDLVTPRGTFAALEALPGSGVPERCPALLVPGFTGSKEDYLGILLTLARAGRRVVAIDMRGQHQSAPAPDHSGYTRAALGADICALLDLLGPDQVHLVGHSFGGLVTREAVIADPSCVASFTLMSSGPAAITGESAARAQALIDALPELGMRQIWELAMEPEAIANGVSAEIVEFLRTRTLGNCETGLSCMAQELLTCPDRVEELAKVADEADLPLMVLYGEDDDAWDPRVQAAMADRLDAVMVVIPGAAHSPAWDAPETTASALTDLWNQAERTTFH